MVPKAHFEGKDDFDAYGRYIRSPHRTAADKRRIRAEAIASDPHAWESREVGGHWETERIRPTVSWSNALTAGALAGAKAGLTSLAADAVVAAAPSVYDAINSGLDSLSKGFGRAASFGLNHPIVAGLSS